MAIVFLIIYFVLMLAIGAAYSSRQQNVEEFVTAGRGLGYWVATFSARTTGESGWLLLGLTGMGYAIGLSAFWVAIGETLGVAVSWLWIIPRFKRSVDASGALTMLDYFESRHGDPRHHIRIVFALILLIMVTIYIAAQLTATGKAFEHFYGMDVFQAEVIGIVIILAYVTMGGFRAVAVSDFVQGLLMLGGLVVVPATVFWQAGGPGPVLDAMRAHSPDLLGVFPVAAGSMGVLLATLGLAGPGLGFLGSPQVYQRVIALQHGASLKRAAVVAILYTIVTDGGAVLTGLSGHYFFAHLADVEAVYPDLVSRLFPPLLIGLFVAAILAAIMSTADSLLMLAATTLVRDCYQKIINPQVSQRRAVFLLRVTVVVISVLALAIANMEVRAIYTFALFAWAGIACAFCPPLILSLFWQRTNRNGVIAGAVVGFVSAFVWYANKSWTLYEMVPGFAFSFVATAAVSRWFPEGKKA